MQVKHITIRDESLQTTTPTVFEIFKRVKLNYGFGARTFRPEYFGGYITSTYKFQLKFRGWGRMYT